MIANSPTGQTNPLTDQAAQTADHAIKSTQHLANGAFDSLRCAKARGNCASAPPTPLTSRSTTSRTSPLNPS